MLYSGDVMEKKGWKKAVLSTLILVASFFYTGVAQGGIVPPAFSKNFAPDPILTGGTSTLIGRNPVLLISAKVVPPARDLISAMLNRVHQSTYWFGSRPSQRIAIKP